MKNEIKLLKNNDKKDWSDIEWLEEFNNFLKGEIPEGLCISKHSTPKLTPKKAFTIIWYLQEHFSIFPDNIKKCSNCDELYDCNSEGIYWESKGKHFCSGCDHLVPYNYDNNNR